MVEVPGDEGRRPLCRRVRMTAGDQADGTNGRTVDIFEEAQDVVVPASSLLWEFLDGVDGVCVADESHLVSRDASRQGDEARRRPRGDRFGPGKIEKVGMPCTPKLPAVELPSRIEVIGGERLLLSWVDGSTVELSAAETRGGCPCAACETFPGGSPMPSVRIVNVERAGAYGLRFTFSDGHNSGIYRFDYLQELGGASRSA